MITIFNKIEMIFSNTNYANYKMDIHGRKCSFCRVAGHTVNNCFTAYQAASILHQSVINVIRVSMEQQQQSRSGTFCCIKNYLKLHNMKELKLITRFHSDFEEFLLRFNQMDFPTIGIHLKRGLVQRLTLYYFTQIEINITNPQKKYNIKTSINNLDIDDEFSCPICLDEINYNFKITTNCNHDVCSKCFETYLEKLVSNKEPCCSLCRTDINCITFTNVDCCNLIKNKYLNNV
jgi:hypothetical protein